MQRLNAEVNPLSSMPYENTQLNHSEALLILNP